VRSSKVFLMDDPLSQLDAKARIQGRNEIRQIHKETGNTIIHVTHDQFEAVALGDRIAVMDAGVLQQVGTAQALYNFPVNMFVAGFIGSPSMNLFPMFVDGSEEDMTVKGTDFAMPVPAHYAQRLAGRDRIVLGLRPEAISDAQLLPNADPSTVVHGQVDLVENTGSDLFVHISAGGQMFIARLDKRTHTQAGKPIDVVFNMEQMHAFDPVSERSLL
jgi:multiple sugar transport system ATP-binding protein